MHTRCVSFVAAARMLLPRQQGPGCARRLPARLFVGSGVPACMRASAAVQAWDAGNGGCVHSVPAQTLVPPKATGRSQPPCRAGQGRRSRRGACGAPVGLQGLVITTSLGGRGPASSAASQSRSGCPLPGQRGPKTTFLPPPVICSAM